MRDRKPLHTFAVCAYRDSPYLEACLRSLKRQTEPSEVICCTSTPSEYIRTLTEKYGVPLYVREGKSNIREDWLFALHTARGQLVTIAHQDDLYHRDYAGELKRAYAKYPDLTVFVSDYLTVKMVREKARPETEKLWESGTKPKRPEAEESFGAGACPRENGQAKYEPVNAVWFVKKLLRLPLRFTVLADRRFIKKSALIFGNSLCCPACTYNTALTGRDLFRSPYEFALDWDNLCELAERPGRFVCSEKRLLAYRVHDGAATKACIEDNRRAKDELSMFMKLWPAPAARLLMHFYKKACQEYET